MILGKKIILPIFILFLLFSSMFISLISIYTMPESILGGHGVYVITSSKDKNPIRSNLNLEIAYGLENMSYIKAVSPEIFVFTVINNKPITVRGVQFEKFIHIENGKIVEGQLPKTVHGAMIGINAAKRFNLHVGDKVTLYGSFTSSIAIVNITAIYKTGHPVDDELVVSLSIAGELAGIAPGHVSIIRVKTDDANKINLLLSRTYPKFTASINSTSQTYTGDIFNVTVRIKNEGTQGGKAQLSVRFEEEWKNLTVYVKNYKNVTLKFIAKHSGSHYIIATVKNDVMYYTNKTLVSVMKKPVFISGPTMVNVNQTVMYNITTVRGENITSGNITIFGPKGYHRYMKAKSVLKLSFPVVGNYTILFKGENYSTEELNVSAYGHKSLFSIATLSPDPINDTFYILKGEKLTIITNGTSYVSIDNSTYMKRKEIVVSKSMIGNHLIKIRVISNNYMGEHSFKLHPVSNISPKIISPIKNEDVVTFGENLTFQILDPIPIKRIHYTYNNESREIFLNQSFDLYIENYTFNITINVNTLHFHFNMNFTDSWGRGAKISAKCKVFVEKDIFSPHIIAKNVTMWSGNVTEIYAYDNEKISELSVSVFGHEFRGYIEQNGQAVAYVKTVFKRGDSLVFVKPGTYYGVAMAKDIAGNENITNFTIIINNVDEKNPPIILGPKIANLSARPAKFMAFDNVGVKNISCYENGNKIKEINGNELNLTNRDFSNGLHTITILAVDLNGNTGYYSAKVLVNYTDNKAPTIIIEKNKIWGGNSTKIIAVDNVKTTRISVFVFDRYYNRTNVSYIYVPTTYSKNGKLFFIPPGDYLMKVTAEDWAGNINISYFHLYINNTNERNPPVFETPNFISVNATDNISISAVDNSEMWKMWAVYEGKTIAITNSSSLSFSASLLPCGYSSITVYAEDINKNVNHKNFRILIKDNVPPHLKTYFSKIWGGNSTKIIAEDNVRISFMSVHFMGRYINTSENSVTVHTKFITSNGIVYAPPGNYTLSVVMIDSSGNKNTSVFNLWIDNHGEALPPIIIGPSCGAVNKTESLMYKAYDNVGVKNMGIYLNGTIIKKIEGDVLIVDYSLAHHGWHNITIFAEDVNGNMAFLNVSVFFSAVKAVNITATLVNNTITTDERGLIIIDLKNYDVPYNYNITISIDGKKYTEIQVYLRPYESKSLYEYLPPLEHGVHTVSVNGKVMKIKVEKTVIENLPTDLVLKYGKNLKFTQSKGVIYKGFQISEGNFILVISALVSVTLILLFFGIYSTTLKSLNFKNIGILRAIGADHRKILALYMRESSTYIGIPVIVGILAGYLLVEIINYTDLLMAFGHTLIIYISVLEISEVLVIGIFFTVISNFIIFRKLIKSQVVDIMGRENKGKIVKLEEFI